MNVTGKRKMDSVQKCDRCINICLCDGNTDMFIHKHKHDATLQDIANYETDRWHYFTYYHRLCNICIKSVS
jgi:hypothetical protein